MFADAGGGHGDGKHCCLAPWYVSCWGQFLPLRPQFDQSLQVLQGQLRVTSNGQRLVVPRATTHICSAHLVPGRTLVSKSCPVVGNPRVLPPPPRRPNVRPAAAPVGALLPNLELPPSLPHDYQLPVAMEAMVWALTPRLLQHLWGQPADMYRCKRSDKQIWAPQRLLGPGRARKSTGVLRVGLRAAEMPVGTEQCR